MDHSDHSHETGEHLHPLTFGEVLARSFPLDELDAREKLHKNLVREKTAFGFGGAK